MNHATRRWAVITGAAGGIGQALVQEFHASGYSVVATDKLIRPANLNCDHYLQADLALVASHAEYDNRALSELKAVLGPDGLHALINNAAIQLLGGAETLTREDWQQTLNVNLLAPFFLSQALLPELKSVQGCIVNISSIHARLTKKNFVAYATSKAALSGLTRSLAVDLCGRVRVNGIEAAAIDTPMLRAGFSGNSEGLRQLECFHPSGRIGTTLELAQLARCIADPTSQFLNGAIIPLDGGIGALLHDPGVAL